MITYHKRRVGLLRKAMELSVLCDQNVFVLIHDANSNRCVHYANKPDLDLLSVFNTPCYREFYSNDSYISIGGRASAIISSDDN